VSPKYFTVRAAQAHTSRRSPQSAYDPVSLPRRPCDARTLNDANRKVVTSEYRLGDVRHITADCSAAERVLGWRAQIDLAHGLADLSISAG
jgi:nucleoside-diphosphate-sugar epimerase